MWHEPARHWVSSSAPMMNSRRSRVGRRASPTLHDLALPAPADEILVSAPRAADLLGLELSAVHAVIHGAELTGVASGGPCRRPTPSGHLIRHGRASGPVVTEHCTRAVLRRSCVQQAVDSQRGGGMDHRELSRPPHGPRTTGSTATSAVREGLGAWRATADRRRRTNREGQWPE